jgi:hypothetical protein
VAPPTARFQVAFDDVPMEPDPTWTDLDQDYPSLVAEYSIDRGRMYELDRCDTGRASVTLNDIAGVLDPTNSMGPFHNKIQPLKQARLALWNPVLEDWYTRFRGFVESFEYEFDASQQVNRVTVSLVDIFEIVAAVEMQPDYFGHTPPEASKGQVYFDATPDGDEHGMQLRINKILDDALIPDEFREVLSGNVSLKHTVYSPGELAAHGRYARFDPEGTAAATSWDFRSWKAGDGEAVAAHPTDTAHLRGFSMSRDLSKIINQAMATPIGISDANVTGQILQDSASVLDYGLRPWSVQDLLTKQGVTPAVTGALTETKKFAEYYKSQYKDPRTRVSSISFRSMHPGWVGAAACWALMSEVDISDRVTVTIGSPGGGGLAAVPYFVEGIHEQYRPLSGDLDDVTLTLDLSPASYFQNSPWYP